jgi:phage terminase large subunit-like protein
MARSPMQELAKLPPEVASRWLAEQEDWVLRDISRGAWWWTGRPEQQAPLGDWFVWLLLSGRGFGKTRTAAEWLADQVIRYPLDTSGFRTEWLLIAETLPDAMAQCVNGPAGIKRVLERRIGPERRSIHDAAKTWRLWSRTGKPMIEVYQGDHEQAIYIEGADDENVGRGYNAAGAWLDEFAKWRKPDGSWLEGIMPSLRADIPGSFPRAIVATTPKLVAQLVAWLRRAEAGDGSVALTTGSTYDNAANLAAPVLAELHRQYHGTRLGAQELHGKLIEEIEGALWKFEWIENNRVTTVPQLEYRVIGVDPAATGESAETGIIAAGRGVDGDDYVLGDWSKPVVGREGAMRCWEMYIAYTADLLVYEDNQGKRWLAQVLADAYGEMQKAGLFPPGGAPPMRAVTAKVAKRLRAEPVSMRYEQNRVHHAGIFGDLETQQITWVPKTGADSPDRLDALVYAELRLQGRERMTVNAVSPYDRQLSTTSLSPLAGAGSGPYG